MLANFFGKSDPVSFLVIVFIFLGYMVSAFFLEAIPLQLVEGDFVTYLKWGGLVILIFFFYNYILAKNKLTLYNSFGFLFYVVMLAMFPLSLFNTKTLLFQLILFLFLRKLFSFRNSTGIIKKLFDAGFWISILFFLEPIALLFWILLIVAVGLFQKLTIRYILVTFIGMLTPLIIVFGYGFWFNKLDVFYNPYTFSEEIIFFSESTKRVNILVVSLFTLSLLSILFKTPKVLAVRGKYRRYWTVILSCFIISSLYIVLHPVKDSSQLIVLLFPMSVLLTNWLEEFNNKWVTNIVLGFFLLLPLFLFIV